MYVIYSNITVYTVYFHEKDIDVKEYQVTVSYFDLTENKVIYTTKMNATSDKDLAIKVPSRYNANGNEYVLLSGQETSLNHDFYSTRRNYTFIYRNVEDLENQNVVVIPGGHQNVVESPNGSVVTIDRTTGTTTVTVPENNTPLVINNNGQLVPADVTNQGTIDVENIDDNKTPLVKGQKQIQNQTPYIIGGSVLVLSSIVLILFFLKKRMKKTEE